MGGDFFNLKQYAKDFKFSKHFYDYKNIEPDLVVNCIQTGSKELDEKPNKFKSMKKYQKGELFVIYNEHEDYIFVITAYWNKRGD